MFSKVFLLAIVAFVEGSLILDAVHPAQPYKFGYSVQDHHGEQHRQESGDGVGTVVGNYGFTDDRGIARQVNYVADHAGFRAQVKTNEPGTANQSPAAVHLVSSDPYAQGAARPYNSIPNSPYVAGAVLADPVTGLGHGHHLPLHHHGYVSPLHHGYASIDHGHHGYAPLHHGHQEYAPHHHGHQEYAPLHGYNRGYNYGPAVGALGYSGLLGSYGGIVNYGAPLVGGAIRGYDSRFVDMP